MSERPESPTKESDVTLREVTRDTLLDILRLRVAPEQERFVASNSVSIAQAYFARDSAWFRGIYADETPVGFLMVEEQSEKQSYYLWRLMIDQRYQRQGFAARALELLVEHLRTRPGAADLYLSCVPGDGTPIPFYEKLGFSLTGEVDDGELVMRRKL